MSFKRREGAIGGQNTNYVDTNFPKCPFCGTNHPMWLSDAYMVKYSLVAALIVNGYKFQCSECGGTFEMHTNNDFTFLASNFSNIMLVDAGRGHQNKHLIGKSITLDELKELCMTSVATIKSDRVCKKCGESVADDSAFCASCGTKYESEDDSTKVFCSKCGEQFPKGTLFCSSCGNKLDEIKETPEVIIEEVPQRICHNCGSIVDIDSAFCANCGTKYEEEAQASEVQVQEETPVQEVSQRICHNCGSIVDIDSAFCANCGTRYEVELQEVETEFQEEPQEEETPVQEIPQRICHNCGSIVDVDSAFCANCGTRYEEELQEVETKLQEEPQEEETPVQEVPQRICHNCGAVVDEEFAFCINCGSKYEEFVNQVEQEDIQLESEIKIEETSQNDMIEINNLSSEENEIHRICSNCGGQVDEPYIFCPACGTKYVEPVIEEIKNIEVAERICSNCGSVVNDGFAFCPMCGTKYVEKTSTPKCPKCGTEIEEDNSFCIVCGTKVR